jgi:hypothetical protein
MRKDPLTARSIDVHNKRRLVRASGSGATYWVNHLLLLNPIGSIPTRWIASRFWVLGAFGFVLDGSALRIALEMMIQAGWIEEAQTVSSIRG